jgi:hypothetical protein
MTDSYVPACRARLEDRMPIVVAVVVVVAVVAFIAVRGT